jgi:hypothetical protein
MTKAERRVRDAMDKAGDVPGLQEAIADAVESMAGEGIRACRRYKRFHWGRDADGTALWRAPLVRPHDVLVELGELVEVAYLTTKDESATWVHPFEARRPVLASTPSGRLVVVGGSYRITSRGIEG